MDEVLICTIGTCAEPAHDRHTPCCSSHGRALCCACYCRAHFVEVHPCTPETHQAAR